MKNTFTLSNCSIEIIDRSKKSNLFENGLNYGIIKVNDKIIGDFKYSIMTKSFLKNRYLEMFVEMNPDAYILFQDILDSPYSLKEDDLYMDSITIDDEFRGLGIGTDIFEFIKKYTNFKRMFLIQDASNETLGEFYQKIAGKLKIKRIKIKRNSDSYIFL